VDCDLCERSIPKGLKRYKSRERANYDLCANCFAQQELKEELFFEIENQVDEDVLHEYHKCDMCGVEPIWGVRFKCETCSDLDLCESCFDKRLAKLNEGEAEGPDGCAEHNF